MRKQEVDLHKIKKLHSKLWYSSDFKVHASYWRILLCLRLHFSRSGAGLRFCISNKLTVDPAAAGLGTKL